MKISIKPFKDHFQKFGEPNIDIKSFKKKYKNICYVNKKVIHHDHSKKENNIIDYICNNCNLKIKNSKELIVLFHNAEGYDNSYMLDIFSKIPNIQISCLGQNTEKFKMLKFLIPNKDYSIKIIDNLAFLHSNLDSLSKDLDDKIITKNHFQDKFEIVNKKLENFPYNYVNLENLENKELPDKKYFCNIKNYGCIMLCDAKTTDKIKNDCLYSQCPMLVSKCKITDKNLSEYQLDQIKNKRNNTNYKSQSEKLI